MTAIPFLANIALDMVKGMCRKIIYLMIFVAVCIMIAAVILPIQTYGYAANEKLMFSLTLNGNISDDTGLNTCTNSGVGGATSAGDGYYFDGNDYLDCGNNAAIDIKTGGLSICLFYNTNMTGATGGVLAKAEFEANNQYDITFRGDDMMRGLLGNANNFKDWHDTNTTTNNNKWHQFCQVWNQTAGTQVLYFNNKTVVGAGGGGSFTLTNPLGNGANLELGRWDKGTAYYTGNIKKVAIWNRSIQASDVSAHYSLTYPYVVAGGETPATPSITPYWSLVNGTNINATNPSYSFYVNATAENTYDTGNITIYLNGVVNVTAINVNVTKNTLIQLNFSELTSQMNVTYNVTVTNTSGKLNGVFLYVDTVPLVIEGYFTKNGVYAGVNNSNFSVGDTLVFYYSQYDENNYESNITFYDANGAVEFSYSGNATGTTNYTYSKSLTVSGIGNHTVKVWGKDAHTIKIMPDIDWSIYQYQKNNITLKGIQFDRNLLKIATAMYQNVNDFALVKRGDRYIFAFNFKDAQVNSPFTIYMDSDKELKYLPNSRYAGHFLLDKYAIDWVSDDITNLQVDYLENMGVWRIRFTPKQNLVVFRSITMINYVEKTYTYSVKAASTGLTDEQYNGLIDAINGGAKKMGYIAIAIIIVGTMFFLFYAANKINTQGESGNTIPINSLLKNIMIIVALFIVVMGSQLALGISTENAYSMKVESALDVIYQVIFWVSIAVLFLVVLGTLANFFLRVYQYLKSMAGTRRK